MARITRRFAGPLAMALVLLTTAAASADVRLPGFFGDHMVMQRDMPLAVWGWADPDEPVTVTLGDATAKTKADAAGQWRVQLPAMIAGGPHKLTVKGKNTIEIADVLIGEVWLCSGQSNMEWTVSASANAQQEIAAGDFPQIRHLKIAHRPSPVPLNDVPGQWQPASPQTVGGFTACGYFMARKLHQELGVPVGIIGSNWGGTRIEPWTPPVGFAEVPALEGIYRSVMSRTPGNATYRTALQNHIDQTQAWVELARRSLENGDPVGPNPAFPEALTQPTSHQEPTMLYNGMIHALVGYPMRGAIWYQGESNHGEGMLYHEKKKALVQGWRTLWGIGDFPFYYVQIAPYRYGNEDPHVLPTFWEAQAASLEIPNTGMVVTTDIATLDDIHPPNKQDVGDRLARLALRRTYGKSDVVDTGPTFKSLTVEADQLRVVFDNAEGLKWRDGKPGPYFEIIGVGTGWKQAEAKIEGKSVVLKHPDVKEPRAMRFGWHKLAEPNLVNGAGLPTGAFRAGEVPKFDALDEIDEAQGYTLVYDLDLANLGATIKYDADQRAKVTGGFDRIAYLIELQSGEGKTEYVWVSMDAFTDDLGKIGVPTADSGAMFQQKVANMRVASNAQGIKTGDVGDGGNIEFWPHNYATQNAKNIPGAANDVYDFGDDPGEPRDGYGSMQVHNFAAQQTLFAINQWRGGPQANLGIGNSEGKTRDWTFIANASSYGHKRLRVFVRPK